MVEMVYQSMYHGDPMDPVLDWTLGIILVLFGRPCEDIHLALISYIQDLTIINKMNHSKTINSMVL